MSVRWGCEGRRKGGTCHSWVLLWWPKLPSVSRFCSLLLFWSYYRLHLPCQNYHGSLPQTKHGNDRAQLTGSSHCIWKEPSSGDSELFLGNSEPESTETDKFTFSPLITPPHNPVISIAKLQIQPRYPSTDEQIKKALYMCVCYEYGLSVKKEWNYVISKKFDGVENHYGKQN